tara:strand:- start:7657 stop:8790 length:1134 start_codon:yes stop_codon:yes gene_type:complete
MGTETQFKTAPTINANLMNLPMMKNYSESQIVTKVDNFRKGEKNLFWFLKLGVFGAVAYGAWVYVLPPVMIALGQFIAMAATAIAVVALIIMAPVIVKGIRSFTRFLHKSVIKFDPFGQLEITRQKMISNQTTFRIAKGNLKSLEQEMEREKVRSKEEVDKGQKDVIRFRGRAEQIREEMQGMITKMGVSAKSEDDYVNLAAELQKTLATATQIANKTKQSEDFTVKFGTRQNVLKKVNQKLVMVETGMDIKISDFDATVEMLKKDYATGQKLNSATTAAKSVLGFAGDWERDYALEVITSTISADIAISAGNFRDIESLTQNYDLNSDELFANLDMIADKIEAGGNEIDIKKYNSIDYKLTSDDKVKSNGFGDMGF